MSWKQKYLDQAKLWREEAGRCAAAGKDSRAHEAKLIAETYERMAETAKA